METYNNNFSLGKVIVVADKGMTTGDNIWYTLSAKNGYILSYSIRGANKKFKDYVLDQNDYRSIGDDFKIKSRLYPREITITAKSGKKIKKSVDEPVYLSRQEHIEAHFLICFVSLVIARLLEHRLKGKYSVSSILDSLKKASCSHIQENYYLFDYYDEVLADIDKELSIDLGKKCLSLGEIKKILGAIKKG